MLAVFIAVLAGSGKTPTIDAAFTTSSTVQLSSKATGADADTVWLMNVPYGDYNFSMLVLTTPATATISTAPLIGEIVGTVNYSGAFGLNNGACASNISATFTLFNSIVSGTTISPLASGATSPAGTGGVLEKLWTDDGGYTNGAGAYQSGTVTVNGLPAQVDRYPSFLNDIFKPDGGSSIEPLARYAGAAKIADTAVTINFVTFANNVLANAFTPPHPFSDLKDVGYTTVVMLNDPTTPGSPVSITDHCSPAAASILLYGESRANPCRNVTASPCNTAAGINAPTPGAKTGRDRYTNPTAGGTYLWLALHQSFRDSDGDGKENPLDPCPSDSDPVDPRLPGGDPATGHDPDLDRIPSACDPTPSAYLRDQDGDGWHNGTDNCPKDVNGTQVESESSSTYATAGPRGGPKTDGIGDECDTAETQCTDSVDNDADGLVNDGCAAYLTASEVGCLNNADDDGDGRVNDGCPSSQFVATGRFETTLTVTAQCIDQGPQVDGDSDGWCATTSPPSLNDPNDGNASRTPEDYDLVFPMGVAHSGSGATPPMRQPVQVCNDGVDNDGDTLIDTLDAAAGASTCRPKNVNTTIDTDGDGYSDEIERHVGTDALGRCEVGASPSMSTDWPSDFVSAGIPVSTDKVNVTDLTSFLAPTRRLDTSPGNANFNVRWDLVPGPGLFANWIVVNDLTSLIAGTSGFPPMPPFSGTKAFGGAACTARPTYGD